MAHLEVSRVVILSDFISSQFALHLYAAGPVFLIFSAEIAFEIA